MVKIAEKANLFDSEMYSLYKEITKTIEKLPFLNTLFGLLGHYDNPDPKVITLTKDLFKYHKMKMDWVHYKVKLNEDPKNEVTEEELKELTETI